MAVAHFVKYQALGNDYIVVDVRQVGIPPSEENARLLCDRRYGIGADGVLFGPTGPVAAGEPVGVRIFNSDGSECEKSGNGLRMFALYLAEHDLAATDPVTLTVATSAGHSQVDVQDRTAGRVRIDMGIPAFTGPTLTSLLDVDGRCVLVTTLDLGNPHTVVLSDEVSRELAHELGEPIAGHPRFPHRTNVQFARVVAPDLIDIEIWERGAGYTLASGSSACAAACAYRALGRTADMVTVRMPGGAVRVDFADDGAAALTGPVTAVASGQFAPALLERMAR